MAKSPKPLLFAVGGAHLDRRGQSSVPFIPGASNPGTMREEAGGGVFNALRLTVQRGVAAELLSIRGGDPAGAMVAAAIDAAGIIDSSAVFIDRATPSYTAILDERGDVVAAIADMALYELALPRQLRRRKVRDAIGQAQAVFCDANLPSEALQYLAGLCAGKALYALAISPAKIQRMLPVFPHLSCLFMNRREALALTGLPGDAPPAELHRSLAGKGLRCAFVSDGGAAALGYSVEGAFTIQPPEVDAIADVTGAGDALAGATIAALLRGAAFSAACREGLAASMLTVQTHSASPGFSPSQFAAAIAAVPPAEPLA